MGAGRDRKASEIAGSALSSLVITGTAIAAVILIFLKPLLIFFGATDTVMPYAIDYVGIIAIGLPFFTLSVGGNHLIRADRSPTYSMMCTLTGAIINTILDPTLIFGFHMGIAGAAWATVIGQVVSGIMVILYLRKFKTVKLTKEKLRPHPHYIGRIVSLGMAPFFNQVFHDGRTDRYEQCFDPLWRKIFLRKRYSIGMCRNHYEDQYDLFCD